MSLVLGSNQQMAELHERIVSALTEFHADTGPQWIALSKKVPGVIYFATDVDPRSFEYHKMRGIWLGRAELLLKAVGEIRPGQFEEISFTLPVRVELYESGEELLVKAFDYCPVEADEP
jgi:hypothetical protein